MVSKKYRNQVLPVLYLCRTIQTHRRVSTVVQEILHDVHDGRHLEEDQHSVTCGIQFGQHPVQKFKLSSHSPDTVVVALGWVDHDFNISKDKWMVTNLSELHDGVVQSLDSSASK